MQRVTDEYRKWVAWSSQQAARVLSSSLIREGASISLLNLFSKAVSFVAGAFAAQCVGASNFGVSGIIIAWAAQASLSFNGGLDAVVAREMAQHPARSRELLASVTTFRVLVAALASALWVILTRMLVPTEQWIVWQLGVALMLCNALNLVYLFQGLGKLPTLNLMTAIASLLAALVYSTFSPPMPLGADLIVVVGLNVASTAATWIIALKLLPPSNPEIRYANRLPSLFRASWKYWIVAIAQFFYTNFQLLILSAVVPEQSVGAYRSALIIANVLEVIFSGFYNSLLPRFVRWQNDGEEAFRTQRRKTLLLFIAIGGVPTGGLALSGSLVYSAFFGAEFASGATALTFLALSKFLNFIGQIYAYTLIVNKQDTDVMKGCLIGSLASLALSLLLVSRYGMIAAALATLLGEVVITALYFWFSTQTTNRLSRASK